MTTVAFVAGQVIRNPRGARRAVTAAAAAVFVVFGMIISLTSSAVNEQLAAQSTAACGAPPVAALGTISNAPSWLNQPARLQNAATIIAVGQAKGVPVYGWQIALATALLESKLVNLPGGDRDSLGLFQQRPSAGWGTPVQIMNPTYAAGKFYAALLAVPAWQQMPLTVAAQAVQRSAFPDAYAQWADIAKQLIASSAKTAGGAPVDVSQLGQQGAQPCPATTGGTGPLAGNTIGEKAVNAALTQLKVPYSWGGGGPSGPSYGFAQGAGIRGYDCSSLMQYSYWQAGHVALPRTAAQQQASDTPVLLSQLRAGDELFFGSSAYHVGIYDGRGNMIAAPHTGSVVSVVTGVLSNSYYKSHLSGAGRP